MAAMVEHVQSGRRWVRVSASIGVAMAAAGPDLIEVLRCGQRDVVVSGRGEAMAESLAGYLGELLEEQPVYDPADPRHETAENTWRLSRTDEDTAADLERTEEALVRLSADWLGKVQRAHPGVGCTFYSWYDEQSGHLRVSLTSSPPSQLPFGAVVALLDSPRALLQQALGDPTPGLIGWDEISFLEDCGDAPAEEPTVVPVWAVTTVQEGTP